VSSGKISIITRSQSLAPFVADPVRHPLPHGGFHQADVPASTMTKVQP